MDLSIYSPDRIRELFQRTHLATARHRRAVARSFGLNDTEVEALGHLVRSDGLTPSQLGELLGLTSGGVTALGQRLERMGHVTRRPHPTDRRSSILLATPATAVALAAPYTRLREEMDAVTARLSDADRELVGHYLEEIVELSELQADETLDAVRDGSPSQPEPAELWS